MTASAGYAWPSRWSVRGAIGAVLDGSLEGEGRTHDIGPGVVAAASVAKQWTFGDWFVLGTLGAGVSRTTTSEAGGASHALVATDVIRAGATAGRTFGVVAPYVLARAFGGPVYWNLDARDVRGSDIYHFQLGVGASVTAASGLSILLDVSALGERSASLGMSLRL